MLVLLLALVCNATDDAHEEMEWDEAETWSYELSQKLFPAPQYVDVVFVGDRSGSMSQYQGSSKAGLRDFIREHRGTAQRSEQDPTTNGVHTHLTVITFDHTKECPYRGDAAVITDEQVEECARAMDPRGSTRLFATAIEEIEDQAKRMRDAEDSGNAVHAIFMLLTDGHDSGGSGFNADDLNRAITLHQARGVMCMFGQAGRDALNIGRRYGFAGARTLEVGNNVQNAQEAIRALTQLSATYSGDAAVSGVSSTTSAPAADMRPLTLPAGAPDDYQHVPMPPMVGRPLSAPCEPVFSGVMRTASGGSSYDPSYDPSYDATVRMPPLGIALSAPQRPLGMASLPEESQGDLSETPTHFVDATDALR